MSPEQRGRKNALQRQRRAEAKANGAPKRPMSDGRMRKRAKDRARIARREAERVEPLFDRLMTIPAFIALDDASQDVLAEAIEAIVSEREDR